MQPVDSAGNAVAIATNARQKSNFSVKVLGGDAPTTQARSTSRLDASTQRPETGAELYRHEVVTRLRSRFSGVTTGALPALAAYAPNDRSDAAAGEVLRTAEQAVANSDVAKRATIRAVRDVVDRGALEAKNTLRDAAETDGAITTDKKVQDGLDALDERVRSGRVGDFNASGRVKEHTRIKIRTAEGDEIKIDVRDVNGFRMSEDVKSGDESGKTVTELSTYSKSKLRIRVEGDLNAAEREAIRSVFAAAEQLADNFYSGDVGAALEIAAGLELDSEQLARVSMNFRSKVRFSAEGDMPASRPIETTATPRLNTDSAVPRASAAAPQIGGTTAQGPAEAGAPTPDRVKIDPQSMGFVPVSSGGVDSADTVIPDSGSDVSNTSNSGSDSFLASVFSYFDQLVDFLQSPLPGDVGGDVGGVPVGQNSLRFEFSQSLKLTILHSAMMPIDPSENISASGDGQPSQDAGLLLQDLDRSLPEQDSAAA